MQKSKIFRVTTTSAKRSASNALGKAMVREHKVNAKRRAKAAPKKKTKSQEEIIDTSTTTTLLQDAWNAINFTLEGVQTIQTDLLRKALLWIIEFAIAGVVIPEAGSDADQKKFLTWHRLRKFIKEELARGHQTALRLDDPDLSATGEACDNAGDSKEQHAGICGM